MPSLSSSSRMMLLVIASMLAIISSSSSSFINAQFTPTSAFNNTGDITITFNPATVNNGEFIFLYSGASCATAPAYSSATETEQTPVVTIATSAPETAVVDPALLYANTYKVCYSATGVFPASYASLGDLTITQLDKVTPSSFYNNTYGGSQTITFAASVAAVSDTVFLYSGADCNTAPAYSTATETERTPTVTVSTTGPETAVVTNTDLLYANVYKVCWSAAADGVTYTELDTIDVSKVDHITPNLIYNNTNGGVKTITFDASTVSLGETVFLYSGSDCRAAPAYSTATETERSPLATISTSGPETVDVDASKLVAGQYRLCHSTTGVFPSSYTSVGDMTVEMLDLVNPDWIYKNRGPVTVTFGTTLTAQNDYVFLYSGAACNTAPAYAGAETERTQIVQVATSSPETATFDALLLADGTFKVCHSAFAGESFPTTYTEVATLDVRTFLFGYPSIISADVGPVTFTFDSASGISNNDYIFLYSGTDCNTAPALSGATQDQVTAVAQVVAGTPDTVTIDPSNLAEGTAYKMCWSPAADGTYPTGFSLFYRNIRVIYTIYMSPSPLNIDQGNVTATMRHVTTGRSVFLLAYAVDGQKTNLGCGDIVTGGAAFDTANRTNVTVINGDLTTDLEIGHLSAGEYTICYSDSVFVDVDTTTFTALAQKMHLIKSKICVGGGVTQICSVSPAYTDKRLGSQRFVLYPARPRSYAYMVRKDSCGAATYDCTSDLSTAIAAGHATPVSRLNFDRSVDITLPANMFPGIYTFCHLNVSSDTIPSFATYQEVTAMSVSVSDSVDPTQTVVSCCGAGNTHVAGTTTWCTVYTYDLLGSPSGIRDDICRLTAVVKDPTGKPVCNTTELYYRDVGRFEFSYIPTVAGTTSATVAHFNMSALPADGSQRVDFASVGSVVNVVASTFDETNSLANCYKSGAQDECIITNRDRFGNQINTCTSRSDDTFLCNGASWP